ncbi:unnamed protein product [Adineta ricciae]|uniref:Uncharacterized protein n=1 Tax=Adineta ricciae TaxID=249248 RepID=A0A814Q9H9_ADIRI|nr:unnamed protein product [Adineta ricciae]CAF1454841.1 unnamed protein product [Adineta ricciae]
MKNEENKSLPSSQLGVPDDVEAEFQKDPVDRDFKNILVVLIMIICSLLTSYFSNNPYGNYLPLILISTFEWYRSYPRQKRSYYGLFRLLLYVVIISLWNVLVLKIFLEIISYSIGYHRIPFKRIEHLFPYALIITSFARTSQEMDLNDKRRYIIHLLYDVPAFLLVLIFKLLNNPLNCLYSQISTHCYLGCLPLPSDVAELNKVAIKNVVNMCAEYRGPRKTYEKYGIKQLYLPTIDTVSPSRQTIEKAMKFMKEALDRNENIFVHCKAGMGRSATIVYCHLIANEHMTPEDAMKLIKEKRPEVTTSLIHYYSVKRFLASLNNKSQ